MAYVIPEGFGVFTIGIDSTETIASASISFGLDLTSVETLTQGEFDTFSNTVRDTLKPLYDANWRIGNTRLTYRQPVGLTQRTNATTELGTRINTDYSPPAVAIVVTKRTGFVGKGNRGRFYLPGVVEEEVSEGGFLEGTYLAELQSTMDTLLVAVAADPMVDSMVLLHDEESPALSPRLILELFVQPIVGTMRPRQSRRSA